MINPISSGSQIPPMRSSQPSMSTDQKEQVQEILSEFSADNLTSEDAASIIESFRDLGIAPSKELEQLMANKSFDAKKIGDMAGVSDSQRPPPPKNNGSDSSEMVSFLEELLENYDNQLSDDDKDSILAAVQEKFGLNDDNDSLVSVKA
jgi:hypothetical protein